MNKTFSISTSVIAPDGWTFVVTQPLPDQELPNGGTGWLGTVDYYVGTGDAIGIGESGDFGLKMSFLGGVEFCTEQIPTPEPTSIAVLALGSAMLMIRRRRG